MMLKQMISVFAEHEPMKLTEGAQVNLRFHEDEPPRVGLFLVDDEASNGHMYDTKLGEEVEFIIYTEQKVSGDTFAILL